MRVAALDLGSNTFICLLCEVGANGIGKIESDEIKVVRLGQGLSSSKRFHTDALKRADIALEHFANTIQEFKPDFVLAMATAAARDAENANELFEMGIKHKIPIEIIPGDREVQISFSGAICDQPKGANYLVIDIGGGSTELIYGNHQKIIWGKSVNTGTVKLKEKFISNYPVAKSEKISLKNGIKELFAEAFLKLKNEILTDKPLVALAVAGTPTELARIENKGVFDVEAINGYQINIEMLNTWIDKLSGSPIDNILNQLNVSKGREDVLLPGLMILENTLKELKLNSFKVSTRGVRFGVALEIYERHKLK
jgi:exopolyphosphatase / guanosine-5'-triphosphate,3'-diphosphate pyrophosphatase